MRYQLKIAFRYLFSKKSTNAINIVTWISMLGMGFGAFSLIVVLSVFNGFEHLVISLHNSFYPDIQITATEGKFFYESDSLLKSISERNEIVSYSKVLEESSYIRYADKDYLAITKGVDGNYTAVTGMQQKLVSGSFKMKTLSNDFAVVGANIANALGISDEQYVEPLIINIPRSDNATVLNADDAFYSSAVLPGGVFSIQQEFDSKYIFVSLNFLRELLGEPGLLSAIEIKLNPNIDAESFREKLKSLLSKHYTIKTKYEQKETLYRIMKMERWAVFAILTFIMIIVSFNIIGSLYMVVLEKRKDISILKSMGAKEVDIQRIFVFQGVFAALIGAGVGLVLGIVVCLLQMYFGFVKLGSSGSTFVVDAYPVLLQFSDILLTIFTVIFISAIASFLPSRVAAKSPMNFKE